MNTQDKAPFRKPSFSGPYRPRFPNSRTQIPKPSWFGNQLVNALTSPEALMAKAQQEQKGLTPPTNIWKKTADGKFRFVKSYASAELAKSSMCKVPKRDGESIFLFGSGKPTDEDFWRISKIASNVWE